MFDRQRINIPGWVIPIVFFIAFIVIAILEIKGVDISFIQKQFSNFFNIGY